MVNKIAGYRTMLGKTQREMAKVYKISIQAYSRKENGKVPFKDSEKIIFRGMVRSVVPNIKIDDIFFD